MGAAIALVLSTGCTATKKAVSTTSTGSATTLPRSTALGNGVTPTTIKVGVTLIDWNCIKAFTTQIRLGQQDVYNAFIKDINDKGGIAGRKIVPYYKLFCPIGSAQLLAICTSLTQDINVFAVLGTFYDTSGDSQTCIAKQEHRVLVTFDLTQAIINNSPPGLIVTPGSVPERSVGILLELVKKAKALQGKTVGVLADTAAASVVNGSIVPGLRNLGVKLGTVGLMSAGSNTDTTTAQAQLASFIERWKTEHVDAVFLSGDVAAAKEFAPTVKKALPNALFLSDTTNVLGQAQQLQSQGVNPNPYNGVITAGGLTGQESDASANWKFCAEIYTRETGKPAEGALQIIHSADGKNILDEHGTISDACQLLWTFHDIAQRVGKYLNDDNWISTVDTFGPIANRGSGPYSSLHAGKFSTEDNWRLQEYDPTIAPAGNWKPLTPLQDITG
ncbi:MAG TPA: hypothetical protein VK771_10735 [Acidimicrobiia bacterium]|nr:hypothetical protein [Acidimicrobiia bacterium]